MPVICAFHHFSKRISEFCQAWSVWKYVSSLRLGGIIRFGNWVPWILSALSMFQLWEGLSFPLDPLLMEVWTSRSVNTGIYFPRYRMMMVSVSRYQRKNLYDTITVATRLDVCEKESCRIEWDFICPESRLQYWIGREWGAGEKEKVKTVSQQWKGDVTSGRFALFLLLKTDS